MEGLDKRINRAFGLAGAGLLAIASAGAYLWVKEPAFTCHGDTADMHTATVNKGILGTTSIKLEFDIAGQNNAFNMRADNQFYHEAKTQAQSFCDGAREFSLDGIIMSVGE